MATRFGAHCMKHCSNLTTVSLSSGENEFYGLVKGAATGLGSQLLSQDWKIPVAVEVLSDSSAARERVNKNAVWARCVIYRLDIHGLRSESEKVTSKSLPFQIRQICILEYMSKCTHIQNT